MASSYGAVLFLMYFILKTLCTVQTIVIHSVYTGTVNIPILM